MSQTHPTVNNWSIVGEWNWIRNPYSAPEVRNSVLQGNVTNHSKFEDNSHILTSVVVEINLKEKFVKTAKGSTYILGDPDPAYAEAYSSHF